MFLVKEHIVCLLEIRLPFDVLLVPKELKHSGTIF